MQVFFLTSQRSSVPKKLFVERFTSLSSGLLQCCLRQIHIPSSLWSTRAVARVTRCARIGMMATTTWCDRIRTGCDPCMRHQSTSTRAHTCETPSSWFSQCCHTTLMMHIAAAFRLASIGLLLIPESFELFTSRISSCCLLNSTTFFFFWIFAERHIISLLVKVSSFVGYWSLTPTVFPRHGAERWPEKSRGETLTFPNTESGTVSSETFISCEGGWATDRNTWLRRKMVSVWTNDPAATQSKQGIVLRDECLQSAFKQKFVLRRFGIERTPNISCSFSFAKDAFAKSTRQVSQNDSCSQLDFTTSPRWKKHVSPQLELPGRKTLAQRRPRHGTENRFLLSYRPVMRDTSEKLAASSTWYRPNTSHSRRQ